MSNLLSTAQLAEILGLPDRDRLVEFTIHAEGSGMELAFVDCKYLLRPMEQEKDGSIGKEHHRFVLHAIPMD